AATSAGLAARQGGIGAWHDLIPEQGAKPAWAVSAVANGESATIFTAIASSQILRSDDGGLTWQSLGMPFRTGYVVGLAVSPAYAADRTVFAVTSSTMLQAGIGDLVVWRSTDGGGRWEPWLEERGAPPVQIVAL